MAKGYGDTRISHWGSGSTYEGDLYFHDGKRVMYHDLPAEKRKEVLNVTKKIQKELWNKLKDVSTPQTVDGKPIIINYTHNDLNDAVRDAMVVLSGKYFSEKSLMEINKSLEKAEYIPTNHQDTENRDDGRNLWFRYKDSEGRGVYFSVTQLSDKRYVFHSITDTLPK